METRTYRVYIADLPNGDFDIMAIEPDELVGADVKPEHFFHRNATGVKYKGEIEISGKCAYLLDSYFSVKN